jgi:flagellar motor switch/type III secretory pathway protein FliN
VAEAASALLASDVTLSVRSVAPFTEYGGAARSVFARTLDGALDVAIEPEPALSSALLGRLLNRPVPLTDPRAPLEPRIEGALAALVVEVARRSGSHLLRAGRAGKFGPSGLRLEVAVRLDGLSYGVTLWLSPRTAPPRDDQRDLRALGHLPLTLSVVAAISLGTRGDIVALSRGDIWMPGTWFSDDVHGPDGPSGAESSSPFRRATARVALSPADGERGVWAHFEGEMFVLRGGVVALDADAADDAPKQGGESMNDRDDTLREIALDAPVVVRVEVASVTLAASEWARLAPGDILATGVKLDQPVVLRIAGREVARGELVDVDGELGVHVRELVDPGAKP